MSDLFLVTGSAGFIGFHLTKKLLSLGHSVIGVDSLNDYYSPVLKGDRNKQLLAQEKYTFFQKNIEDKKFLVDLFAKNAFQGVFHLAAQAGVRYSLECPEAYLRANIDGTLNILEAARFSENKPTLLMASSSSVYGLSKNLPFSENDPADRPAALYGATKRANELMAHSYTHLFGLETILMRFFTVYGPWGRPDMALFKFVQAIANNQPIDLYNHGDMVRDFTYIDDIVRGIWELYLARVEKKLEPFEIFNIGCGKPRALREFVRAIETSVGKKAKVNELPFQLGDVYQTAADTTKLRNATGYAPEIDIELGIKKYVEWYLSYYGVTKE